MEDDTIYEEEMPRIDAAENEIGEEFDTDSEDDESEGSIPEMTSQTDLHYINSW